MSCLLNVVWDTLSGVSSVSVSDVDEASSQQERKLQLRSYEVFMY